MNIREMQLLVRVAETGSMTQAAGQLDLTPAAVSAAVQRIEAALGMRLFERTTRTLHPTDEGLVILEGCHDTVQRWQRALDEARGNTATLEGSVRLSAPADTTHQVVGDAVAEFCALHPGVRVVVHPTDTLQNVLQEALDVSIRYGDLDDSTLVARKLAESPRVLVASAGYLERRGHPAAPEDLAAHRQLTLQLGNTPERSWELGQPDRKMTVPLDSPMCGDGLLVRRWAVAGHGVAFKSLFDVIDDLETGRLVRVLPDLVGSVTAIHAVFPSRKFVPARVRGLVDHLAGRFAAREARCQQWLGSQRAGTAGTRALLGSSSS
jgi:DNA-binding transcriptional LysR family regulator